MDSDKKQIKEGWEKQATYDDPRLSEMVEMYEEIGLEVHLEPFNAENETGCTGCMQLMPDLFKTIYTRGKAEQGMTSDEGRDRFALSYSSKNNYKITNN